MPNRCWNTNDQLYNHYHDYVWGIRVDDDKTLFEFLILEGAQAGLSWITILKRQGNYQKAFDNFDFYKIAAYDDNKVNELMNDVGIIRNRRKIESTITNARSFINIINEYGSFATYLWGYVNNQPLVSHHHNFSEVPVENELSRTISKDLIKRGFKFVGPTIIYSYLQAVGVINDHLESCDFKYQAG